jgi:hypothetical protein
MSGKKRVIIIPAPRVDIHTVEMVFSPKRIVEAVTGEIKGLWKIGFHEMALLTAATISSVALPITSTAKEPLTQFLGMGALLLSIGLLGYDHKKKKEAAIQTAHLDLAIAALLNEPREAAVADLRDLGINVVGVDIIRPDPPVIEAELAHPAVAIKAPKRARPKETPRTAYRPPTVNPGLQKGYFTRGRPR